MRGFCNGMISNKTQKSSISGTAGTRWLKCLIDKSFAVVCAPVEQSCNTEWTQEYKGGFDYLIAVEALECTENPEQVLQSWRSLLKEEGRLLLGMNNRFGIRYFCGDRDPYTGRNFDGIEGYRRAYDKKEDVFRGRCYSRNEMEKMLRAAGWNFFRFFLSCRICRIPV